MGQRFDNKQMTYAHADGTREQQPQPQQQQQQQAANKNLPVQAKRDNCMCVLVGYIQQVALSLSNIHTTPATNQTGICMPQLLMFSPSPL